jgi:CRP/FNR family transcriptional regulator, cyclic AMP receptor protein
MTKRRVNAGQILFHKGDPAGEMFMVASGRLRLSEIAVDVLPGGVVGEMGLLAPNQRRTQTLECIEDAEVMQIGHDRVKSLYFENPSFGFYLLCLTSARLFQNITKFEVADPFLPAQTVPADMNSTPAVADHPRGSASTRARRKMKH